MHVPLRAFCMRACRNLSRPALKADLARYLIVHTFGGVYSDVDTLCLRPIDTWADGNQVGACLMTSVALMHSRALQTQSACKCRHVGV